MVRTRMYCLVFALLLGPVVAQAQETVPAPDPRPSPMMMARTSIGNGTTLLAVYGAPQKRDRQVFGGLVPYGEVWRLGANEATHFTTTGPITFGGQALNPGTYTLFAIPGQNEWQIVINRQTGQWGTQYNQQADLARVTVPARRSDQIHEALTMRFEQAEGGTDLQIMWDDVQVIVPIKRRYTAPPERLSPTAIAQTTFDNGTYAKVTYSSPRKRDREIFGALVPYGEVWRLGANEATELTVTDDVMLGDQHVEAGTYALFAVPHANRWEVVLSKQLGQWGAYTADPANEIARISVPVQRTGEQFEAFTIVFANAENGRMLVMAWDDVQVRLPIRPM